MAEDRRGFTRITEDEFEKFRQNVPGPQAVTQRISSLQHTLTALPRMSLEITKIFCRRHRVCGDVYLTDHDLTHPLKIKIILKRSIIPTLFLFLVINSTPYFNHFFTESYKTSRLRNKL